MKNLIRVSMAVLTFALLFATSSFAADTGADLYKANCASCHGASGAADTTMGKNLKLKDLGSGEVQKQSDAELTTVVEKGKKPMPAYEGKLSKDQIQELVKYIRTLKK
ncbi:MAG: cytochrome C [Acidobacteria bacterium]|nr:MAG: cytochrome C [Acidobacteriota bacterium]PYY07503.1 MAG: cytochrome C [Acidobacteriota bacterium]